MSSDTGLPGSARTSYAGQVLGYVRAVTSVFSFGNNLGPYITAFRIWLPTY